MTDSCRQGVLGAIAIRFRSTRQLGAGDSEISGDQRRSKNTRRKRRTKHDRLAFAASLLIRIPQLRHDRSDHFELVGDVAPARERLRLAHCFTQ